MRPQQAGQGPEQGGLAGPVRTDEGEYLAPLDAQREVVQYGLATIGTGQVSGFEACHERAPKSPWRVFSTYRKNGPPSAAVSTPAGSSCGASAVRAISSA